MALTPPKSIARPQVITDEIASAQQFVSFELPPGVTNLTGQISMEQFPLSSGGFADVYRGQLGSKVVAVKRLRVYTLEQEVLINRRYLY